MIYMVLLRFHSTPSRLLLTAPLVILAGLGIHLLGFLGHDGTHLSLHSNKHVSMILGLFFSSMIVTFCEMGFAFEHWNHHRYCNQSRDPDIKALSRLRTWWQRAFLTRITYNCLYMTIMVRFLRRQPLHFEYRLPFRDPMLRKLCWTNVAFSTFWLVIYIGLSIYDWRIGVYSILLPTVTALLAAGPQSYIDHAGTRSDKIWENTRTRTSRLATIIWFGGNYHLMHHLYPGVPNYRLPMVHRYLEQQGIFEAVKPPIEHSFFAAYKHLGAPYTATDLEDVHFDPHRGHPVLESASLRSKK